MTPIKCIIKIKFGIPSSGLCGSGCKYGIAYNKGCEKCKHFSASRYYASEIAKRVYEGLRDGIRTAAVEINRLAETAAQVTGTKNGGAGND